MRFPVIGFTLACLLIVPASAAPPNPAPSEIRQWNTAFFASLDGNQTQTAFSFGDSALNNTPGVFPLAGALMSFRELVGPAVASIAGGCQTADVFDAMNASSDFMAKFRAYATQGVYATPLNDPILTSEHVSAVLAAGGSTFSMSGTLSLTNAELLSTGLQLRADLGSAAAIKDLTAP